MYSTYIYGTPLGFDFYEDVASLRDYFKAFYISSRTGARLMVNRRADGVTLYNYLRYGLAESGGRPRSFFGMTVAMDGGEYARNFKEVFDWFDYLFATLVSRGALFHVNDGGIVQYRVSKFAEAAEEVEWLKANMPNVFTQSAEVGLSHYDATFQAAASGQIRCFNDATPEPKILDAYRRYSWVALSPGFKPEEEPIEISPGEIEDQLNGYTKQLLNIAMDPRPQRRAAVKAIADGCDEVIALVRKYLKFERDADDRAVCDALILAASDCRAKAAALMGRIPEPITTPADPTAGHGSPAPQTRLCAECGARKPLSAFASPGAEVCMECESRSRRRGQARTRLCAKCGQDKPLSHFEGRSLYCDECMASSPRHGSASRLNLRGIGLLAAVLAAVLIIWRPWKSSDPKPVDPDPVPVAEEHFDPNAFQNCISSARYQDAYDILGILKADPQYRRYEAHYEGMLRDGVEKHIAYLINFDTDFDNFLISNNSLLENLRIDSQEWISIKKTYDDLNTLLKKNSFSTRQRNQANQLVAQLPANWQADYQRRVDAKPNDRDVRSGATTPATATTEPSGTSGAQAAVQPYITVTAGGVTTDYFTTGDYTYGAGTSVTVKPSPGTQLQYKDCITGKAFSVQERYTFTINSNSLITVSSGNIVIMIRGRN